MNRTLLLFGLLTACAAQDDGGGSNVDAPITPSFEYQPFTARTRSLGHADRFFQLSTTDTIGPIACGVAQDHHAALGTSGHQILASLGFTSGVPCPTGTHTIRSGCSPVLPMFGKNIPEGCAYYRRFSAQGQALGTIAATAGAITVTGDDLSCSFTVNLSFSGEAYTDTFTLTNGLTADPWCKQ